MIVLKDFDPIATESVQEQRNILVSEEAPVLHASFIVYRDGSRCRFNEMPSNIAGFRSNECESLEIGTRHVLLEPTFVFLN
jgi:hypothetical protein